MSGPDDPPHDVDATPALCHGTAVWAFAALADGPPLARGGAETAKLILEAVAR